MTAIRGGAAGDLPLETACGREPLADGATLLRGFARADAARLVEAVDEVARAAPFRHMVTPGAHRMSSR